MRELQSRIQMRCFVAKMHGCCWQLQLAIKDCWWPHTLQLWSAAS
jgi:hypothetical protein